MGIPKIIHYCWFGGNKKPALIKRCIRSWKKYCPDYKIVEWNENNFDIHCIPFCEQAYEAKKWAFVSDYARLKVLLDHGGIYMDTDVQIFKNLDCFLNNEAFSCFENATHIPTALMASAKGNRWMKMLLDDYDNRKFIRGL